MQEICRLDSYNNVRRKARDTLWYVSIRHEVAHEVPTRNVKQYDAVRARPAGVRVVFTYRITFVPHRNAFFLQKCSSVGERIAFSGTWQKWLSGEDTVRSPSFCWVGVWDSIDCNATMGKYEISPIAYLRWSSTVVESKTRKKKNGKAKLRCKFFNCSRGHTEDKTRGPIHQSFVFHHVDADTNLSCADSNMMETSDSEGPHLKLFYDVCCLSKDQNFSLYFAL